MKKILVLIIGFAVAGSMTLAHADSLELIDGSVLEGVFVEASDDLIVFESGGSYEGYHRNEVIAIFLSEGVAVA